MVVLQDTQNFDNLISAIKSLCGIDLAGKKEIVKQKLASLAIQNNIATYEALLNRLIVERKFRQDLLDIITINETYFYREVHQLESAIYYAKQQSSQVHILCVPCSSGEEVYSLGMIAYLNNLDKSKITITGIDINSKVIRQCEEGIYSARSLQKLALSQKNVFFEKIDDTKYRIKSDLMPFLRFKKMNIFDPDFIKLGKFDIILSRNMLIYFDEEFRLKAISKFHQMLNVFGRFYAGNSDIIPYVDAFKKRTELGVMFYEKIF